MKEIFSMWRMCRLLKKHRAEWVVQIAMSKAYDDGKELLKQVEGTPHLDAVLTQETTMHLLHDEEFQRDLKVNSNGLLHTYIQNYIWKEPKTHVNISTDKKYQIDLVDARSILRMCISHKPQFIKRNGNLVWLSTEGESFAADWFGLSKQYLIEMGVVWTAISGLVVGLLPYVIPVIINLFTKR